MDMEDAVDKLIELLYLKGYQPKIDFFMRQAKIKRDGIKDDAIVIFGEESGEESEEVFELRAGMYIFPNKSLEPYYLELQEDESPNKLKVLVRKEQTEIIQSSKVECVVNLRPIIDCKPAETLLKIVDAMISAVDFPSEEINGEMEDEEDEEEEGGEDGTGGDY